MYIYTYIWYIYIAYCAAAIKLCLMNGGHEPIDFFVISGHVSYTNDAECCHSGHMHDNNVGYKQWVKPS